MHSTDCNTHSFLIVFCIETDGNRISKTFNQLDISFYYYYFNVERIKAYLPIWALVLSVMTDYFMFILNNLITIVILLRIREQAIDLLYLSAYTSTLFLTAESLKNVI